MRKITFPLLATFFLVQFPNRRPVFYHLREKKPQDHQHLSMEPSFPLRVPIINYPHVSLCCSPSHASPRAGATLRFTVIAQSANFRNWFWFSILSLTHTVPTTSKLNERGRTLRRRDLGDRRIYAKSSGERGTKTATARNRAFGRTNRSWSSEKNFGTCLTSTLDPRRACECDVRRKISYVQQLFSSF